MSELKKISSLIFLFLSFIIFAKAYENLNTNQIDELSDDDSAAILSKTGRRDYEGISIEVGDYRRKEEPQQETEENINTQETTVPTTTPMKASAWPPLHRRFRRIYNPDEQAEIEDYPFMAAVLVNQQLWCGGVIIGKDKVLTAAHCLQLQYRNWLFREYLKMLTVRVGSSNATAGGEELRVVDISFHPNYKPSTLEFNVAVLHLHKNLSLDQLETAVDQIPYANTAVLPTDQNIIFLGWGSVLNVGGTGGAVLLQKIVLPIYDFADCQELYGRDIVTRTNFCAGYISKEKNVCNHDAGGPAIAEGVVVGLLSYSSKRCDATDQPAVFTNVGAVAPWLDELDQIKTASIKY